MQTKKTIIKVTAVLMALATTATFAACKKKDKALVSTTTQTTTKGPGLEDITREETTVITDENGNEKTYIIGKNDDGTTTIYEKVLDENGKVVKGDDGKVVTKVYVTPTQPETPVDATQATEGTTKAPVVEKTTKTPKPNTTQAPKPTNPPAPTPQPTPTPTPQPDPTPPQSGIIYDGSEVMKRSMVKELMAYARSLSYAKVYGGIGEVSTTVEHINDWTSGDGPGCMGNNRGIYFNLGDKIYGQFDKKVTYDYAMNCFKEEILRYSEPSGGYRPERADLINIQWSSEYTDTLFVYIDGPGLGFYH